MLENKENNGINVQTGPCHEPTSRIYIRTHAACRRKQERAMLILRRPCKAALAGWLAGW